MPAGDPRGDREEARLHGRVAVAGAGSWSRPTKLVREVWGGTGKNSICAPRVPRRARRATEIRVRQVSGSVSTGSRVAGPSPPGRPLHERGDTRPSRGAGRAQPPDRSRTAGGAEGRPAASPLRGVRAVSCRRVGSQSRWAAPAMRAPACGALPSAGARLPAVTPLIAARSRVPRRWSAGARRGTAAPARCRPRRSATGWPAPPGSARWRSR